MRTGIMLQFIPFRLCPCIYKDGKGTEFITQPYEDIRCMWKAYVLP